MIRLSLVIPAYNEEALLPRLLDTVDAARARYSFGTETVEVIVADNGSTDGTAAIAAARGCVVAPVVQRVIAASRNGGAALASGEILCFVDADMQIHPDTFNGIERAMADPANIGGATGVHLERMSAGIASAYAMLIPLVWLTNMDTGVVFLRRADFVAIRGYDQRLSFAEDVDFLWKLKRLGWSRGQRLTRLRSLKAIASTRKFDRYGDWHYVTRMPIAMIQTLIRRDRLAAFVKQYWYEDRE
ncbi:MAG: glycosyltransferase [Vicinamibacterales bacterium]